MLENFAKNHDCKIIIIRIKPVIANAHSKNINFQQNVKGQPIVDFYIKEHVESKTQIG